MNKKDASIEDPYIQAGVNLLEPPGGSSKKYLEISSAAQHDLGMETVIAAFTAKLVHQKEIRRLFTQLLLDPQVIIYRLDVLGDLLQNPELVEWFEALLPVIDSLAQYAFRSMQTGGSLHEVIWRIGELQNIIDCQGGFRECFQAANGKIHSQGLLTLQAEIQHIQDNPTYQHLGSELPALLTKLRTCASITIGVNLDASLRPIQATLISVNDTSFTDQSLLNKLFGFQKDQEGIAPLHSVPQRQVPSSVAIPIISDLGWAVDPMLVPLFADLAKILEKTTAPIAKKLQQYTEVQSLQLINLRPGLIYYLGAVRFLQRLQATGLPIRRPQIAPVEDHICAVKDSYNVNLALRYSQADPEFPVSSITTNDIQFGPEGRILILTGPNQGGKTTYLQGVGLVQVLAQVGCYVPGTQALISPVDQLLTHFPLEEKPETETGRFGDEAQRLESIFQQVTRNSLVLLNETLSGTSFAESLYLAQDILRILRRIGVRVIFSTHMHELATRVEELNE